MLRRSLLKSKSTLKRTTLKKKSKRQAKKDYELEKIRPSIIQRDEGRCLLCGGPYQEIHHITYRSSCGGHTLKNLCCLCWNCHRNVAHGIYAKDVKKLLQQILQERYGYEY